MQEPHCCACGRLRIASVRRNSIYENAYSRTCTMNISRLYARSRCPTRQQTRGVHDTPVSVGRAREGRITYIAVFGWWAHVRKPLVFLCRLRSSIL